LQNEHAREIVNSLSRSAAVAERIENLTGLSEPQAVDQYWRELVDSRSIVKEIERTLSIKELRENLANVAALRANGIDLDQALRDAEIVGAINRTITRPGEPKPSMQTMLDALARGVAAPGSGGHQWPPIIRMSEADGYFFKSGSAELSPAFQDALITRTASEILGYIRKYDVDVVEVVGHTDERPIGARQFSNLDRDLLPVLKNDVGVVSLVPADNAGLGLARAVAVVSVLRQSPQLSGYKLIPLSGAQLVNTDETLAIAGTPGDIRERRRIEIRLRKSNEATGSLPAAAAAPAAPR
jgi:outer membrane protein OmpA-like peptidoglycan-associated protein